MVFQFDISKRAKMFQCIVAILIWYLLAGSRGKMVVTMRPIPEDLVEQARRISRQYPQAHGAPIATGDPAEIGIADLSQPDWGDAVEIQPDEIPVYWACGVTPQNVLLDAKLPICITHSPGHMLVTDVSEDAETTILPNPQNS